MPNLSHNLIDYLRTVAGAWQDDPRDDGELLSRFVEFRDETAFKVMIWRHGPMVWRTCRRVLGNGPDTEDSFQVVFMALAKKAKQVRSRSLAGWLHRVARQTALDVDIAVRRRRNLEHQPHNVERPKEKDAEHNEIQKALDEELIGLPEKLRIPLVLRYLEEKTQEEVAHILGCSRSVALRRLERGEACLRERLQRRGLAPGTGTVAMLLGGSTKASVISVDLISRTARAAVAFRAGNLTGVPAEAAAKLLQSLSLKGTVRKLWWMALVCVVALGVGGVGLVTWKMYVSSSDAVKSEISMKPDVSKQVVTANSKKVDIYGDPLPEGALARLGTVRWRNTDPILAPISFTPDGKTVIQGARDRLLMWEFPGGKRLRSLDNCKDLKDGTGKDVISWANAVSADGNLLAIGTMDGDINLWDLRYGKQVKHLEGNVKKVPVLALAFLQDGKTLAAGMGGNTLKFWNITTGVEVRRVDLSDSSKRQFCFMVFSPNGRIGAASASDGLIRLWDLETGQCIGEMNGSSYKHGSANLILSFSADGRKLATTGDDAVTLWDVSTRKAVLQLKRGYKGDGRSLQLSPDGKVLATSGDDEGSIRLWNACTGESLYTLAVSSRSTGFEIGCRRMAFSPDSGVLVAKGVGQTLKLWNVSTGKPLSSPEGHEWAVDSLAFSPDGKSMVSVSRSDFCGLDSTILIWDIESSKLSRQQVERKGGNIPRSSAGTFLIYSPPDGKRIVSIGEKSDKGLVLQWDAITGKQLPVLNLKTSKWGCERVAAFTPDGKILAVAQPTGERTIEFCDAVTGKQLRTLENYDLEGWRGDGVLGNGVTAVAFSSDGRKFASVHPAGIAIWDAATCKRFHSLTIQLQAGESDASVSSVVFSPNGRMLISGGASDKTLRLWEIASGKELLEIPLESGRIQVAISPDGKLIASASEDETIRLWDVVTGKQLHQFPRVLGRISGVETNNVRPLVFAPDGRSLASGNKDSTILIWDVTPWVRKERQSKVVSSDELQAAWSALADADASKAYRALGKLVAAFDQAVPLLAEQMRSTAVAPQSTAAVSQRVAQLLADLNADDFQVRNHSQEELFKMAYAAEPMLRHSLEGNLLPEQRKRVEDLLDKWSMNGANPKLLQRLRGVAVLEHIGTDAARQVLQELAVDPAHDEISDEARAVLQRLSRRPR